MSEVLFVFLHLFITFIFYISVIITVLLFPLAILSETYQAIFLINLFCCGAVYFALTWFED